MSVSAEREFLFFAPMALVEAVGADLAPPPNRELSLATIKKWRSMRPGKVAWGQEDVDA